MSILSKTRLGAIRPLPWWTGYSLSLVFPLTVLGFLASGPHRPLVALLWTLPMLLLLLAEYFGPAETRVVPEPVPASLFDALLYLLSVLQLLNLFALGRMVSQLGWSGMAEVGASLADLLVVRTMVSADFVSAGICPAHELIHRRSAGQRHLGRLLLATLGYDHFYLAHKLGHHARLGSADDPSTAFRGESFEAFYRRGLRQQWRIAWSARRGAVLAGMAFELGWLGVYTMLFGPLAMLVLLHQARGAIRTLESVNYFQHYGLAEDSGPGRVLAWRNDSAVSLFMFLALTRHADHHRRPGVSFWALRPAAEGPQMPYGYMVMALWVQRRNESFRTWAERQLDLRRGGVEPRLPKADTASGAIRTAFPGSGKRDRRNGAGRMPAG
ncbi:fatty acid desaturase [Methylococcus capsulatus]|uniref:fatty acid desaturase n=1 Tax=Methylococcus capsulatus TaxID=414 RepID=UPI002FD934B5